MFKSLSSLFGGRECLAIAGVCLGLVAGVWWLTVERVALEREQVVANAVKANSNLALAFEEQTVRSIKAAEQALLFAKHEWEEDRSIVTLEQLQAEGNLATGLLVALRTVDAEGFILLQSGERGPVNVADREYFAYHRDFADATTRIGKPVIGRVSGGPLITLSRRLTRSDGSFGGICFAAVDPAYFIGSYQRFDVGREGIIQLVGLDGVSRARRASDRVTFGEDMQQASILRNARRAPVGNYVSAGTREGVARYQSYRTLAEYPLVVSVGTSVDETLAEFRERERKYYLMAVGASAVMVAFAVALLVATRRRQRAIRSLAARDEQLRQLTDNIQEVFWLTDPAKNRVLYVSPGYERVWGRSCASLYASPRQWIDAIHPEDRERVLQAALTQQVTGSYAEEYRIIRPDGEIRWIRDRAFPVSRTGDGVYRIAGLAQDITESRRAAEELRESDRRLQHMLGNVQLISITLDQEARLTYCNDYLLRLTGRRREEVIGADWFEMFIPPEHGALKDVFLALLDEQPQASHHENEIVTCTGERRMIRWNNTVLHSPEGTVIGTASIGEDITEYLRAEARLRATFEQNAVGISHASVDGRFITVNPKFCRMLGYDEAELVGRTFEEVTTPEDRAATRENAARLLRAPVDAVIPEFEKRYLCKDGSVLWASIATSLVRKADGAPDYFIAMVTDITARKRAEEMVVYQAHYDALTELPNRNLFHDRLAQTVSQARRHGWNVGVIALDLDRFHNVNDTLGHAIGDRLLQEVAKRLSASVRGGDTAARIGGDGFGVIAADLAQAQDAGLVAQKVLDAIAQPFVIDGHEIHVGASAGVAVFPADGADVGVLMKNADAAMLHAKQLGRNNYRFYAAAMNAHAMEKLLLENDLRRGLERSEFRLHLQPKASLATGRVVGFEALLRWQRTGNGLVSPGEFVPLLEETGLIVPVGAWVIRAACAQLAEWQRAGLVPLPIAVNLAAKQFTSGDLVKTVDAALAEHGVAAHLLELEVTESDAMQNPEAAIVKLGALKVSGVQVSIDDFGTGYSSLSYLKRFPVDKLKLDRSFVSGLPADAHDVSIARAVITMAHSLGLQVVAEGVENAAQRDFLAERGCDEMQGYLLSRPLPPADVVRYLRRAMVPASARCESLQ